MRRIPHFNIKGVIVNQQRYTHHNWAGVRRHWGCLSGVWVQCTLEYSHYVHLSGGAHIYCKSLQLQQQQQLIFLKEKFWKGRTVDQLNGRCSVCVFCIAPDIWQMYMKPAIVDVHIFTSNTKFIGTDIFFFLMQLGF